jgi:anti-sigma factor RsiW
MNMNCSEGLKTQALYDGELEGEKAAEAERHAATCEECKNLLGQLTANRNALRRELSYFGAPDNLRSSILEAITAEERAKIVRFPVAARRFWQGVAAGGLGMAAAAALAVFALLPPESDALVAEVTDAHIRSTGGAHLVDVASADPAQTERWLKAHTGVASPYADAATGFSLIGGRADYVYGASSAVTVYRHGGHTVDVFAWAEDEDEALPAQVTNKGYNIVIWKKGSVVFCAISNIPMVELEKLASALGHQTA